MLEKGSLRSTCWLWIGIAACQADPPVATETEASTTSGDPSSTSAVLDTGTSTIEATGPVVDGSSSSSETQGTETRGTETQGTGSETRGTETQGTETQGTETQGTETQGTETQGSETQGTETQGTETQGTGTQGTETGSRCGDGLVEGDELCDDGGESALCNADCSLATCGDGLINSTAGEECEGAELMGATCESLGFDDGTLVCGGGCTYATQGCYVVPAAPALTLSFSQIKQFDFSWPAAAGADYYQLLESSAVGEPFVPLGPDVFGESISITMPLYLRYEASYVLRACNAMACTDSAPVDVMGSLAEAVGYLKASNASQADQFGGNLALSGDGNTLAVAAVVEASNSTGIDGDQADDSAMFAGAVYVFVRDPLGQWSQQAYVKASNTGAGDWFGASVALSDDGDTLAVGAWDEDSNATGINGNQANGSAATSGAVYVFVRDAMEQWSQQAYVKASNTGASDRFGQSVALSGDGDTLAVGAIWEDSSATGVGGNQASEAAFNSGAVYVFVRDAMEQWSQQAYIKASNTGSNDSFGVSVALSETGSTLVVGASGEDGNATGINGNQASEAAPNSGAVYVFVRDAMAQWSQQAYVKASNTGSNDGFGWKVASSDDGDTVAVATYQEDSSAVGIDGNQANEAAVDSGAVYVLVRDAMAQWSQQAYVKASNTAASDAFGHSVSLSADGSMLAVGAVGEDSSAVGLDGNQANDALVGSGAAYVLERDAMGQWSQRAYLKAPNPDSGDYFGSSMMLSDDGDTLAIGANGEASNATGLGGDQTNDSAVFAGAAYLF